ncbi:MAG: hypothetical protein ABI693_21515 [Bryobacteraceae bacterium]
MQCAVAFAFLAAVSAVAIWWFYGQGCLLWYGDAQAHINIARRIIDSRNPGYEQLGTVWLPVLHLLMLPFVGNNDWWRTGLAGSIPVGACFVAAGLFLFGITRRTLGSVTAAFTAVALFALNPNLLYLQSTPMTEAVYFAGLLGLIYSVVLFAQTQSGWAVLAAAVLSNFAAMTRYDGWFLIPFAALAILVTARKRRFLWAFVFGVIASLGPLWWLAHNYVFYGDALEFYRGRYSAKGIYKQALDAGMGRYAGDGDWGLAWLYFRSAATSCAGPMLLWMGAAGGFVAVIKRAWWPLVLLLLGPVFYVMSMHSSGTPIFVPYLWPHSWYNSRYGLAALPLLAFAASGLVAVVPGRARAIVAALVVACAVAPWLVYPHPESWITWKESQVNSEARRAWTYQAADYLRANYAPHSGVLASFGDLTGIFGQAGIPLRETLHEGNDPHFTSALHRPDLFLREEWVVAIAGDQVSAAMPKTELRGTRYPRVKTITVKGGPVIEIYRRSR